MKNFINLIKQINRVNSLEKIEQEQEFKKALKISKQDSSQVQNSEQKGEQQSYSIEMSMNQLFQQNEQEYCRFINSINQKFDQFQQISNEKREKLIGEIQYELNESDKSFKQMQIGVCSVDQSSKKDFQSKVQKYKQELDQIRKKFLRLEESYLEQKNRENVLTYKIEMQDHKLDNQRFLKQGIELSDGIEKLREGKKNLYEAVQIGENVQQELLRQNEVLDKNIKRTHETIDELSASNSLLTTMKNNIVKNKLILYGVASLVILAAIIIFAYRRESQ